MDLFSELKSKSPYNMVKYSKRVNSVALTLILIFGIVVFAGVNLLIYYLSKRNDKRKTKLGICMLILSPAVFYGTLQLAAIFDNGGFGAGIFALLYGVLFFINGIIILWISA